MSTLKWNYDWDKELLEWLRKHPGSNSREVYENFPYALNRSMAKYMLHRLKREGLIERSETAGGKFAGWVVK